MSSQRKHYNSHKDINIVIPLCKMKWKRSITLTANINEVTCKRCLWCLVTKLVKQANRIK